MVKHRSSQKQLDLLIIYYWALQVFSFIWVGMTLEDFRFSFFYFATVLPILFFLGVNFPRKIFSLKIQQITAPLYIYMALVTLISLVRSDYSTAYNVIILSLFLIIVIENELTINLKLINMLFVWTIIFCVYSYHANINPYGYLPLQGRHVYYLYRVSLFPKAVVGSSFFAFFVFLINYFFNQGRSRRLFIILSLYFAILGASRTVLVCLFLTCCFLFFCKIFIFRNRTLYYVFFLLAFVSVVAVPYGRSFFLHFNNLQNDYLNYVVYHDDSGVESKEDLDKVNSRPLIWKEHYKIFKTSPFIGKGTYSLNSEFNFSGSESFLTGWLARVGLLIIPLVLFFLGLIKKAMITQNQFLYSLLLCIFVIMLNYGSFMVPYNFLFILMFGLINMNPTDFKCYAWPFCLKKFKLEGRG